MRLHEAARAYLGAPWLDNGRSVAGVDCIGLVWLALRDAGYVEIDPDSRAGRHMPPATLSSLIARHAARVRTQDARPDDIALWRMGRGSHVGIVAPWPAGGLALIHAPLNGLVREVPLGPGFDLRGAYRCR